LNGDIWIHPNIQIGYITQYTIEELGQNYGDKTILEYTEQIVLRQSKASSEIIKKGLGDIRQYLGGLGLGSTRVLSLPIKLLSGGEKMRLSFATIFSNEPHLLLLDESANHVDLETQQSMASALQAYTGSVVMVSHNQAFLSSFCRELWILNENGCITRIHNDTESFDEIFTKYRQSLFQQHHSITKAYRHNQLDRAKKVSDHKKASKIQITGLL
jgi:ATP-binding cassette, subfamily F, member 3